MKTKGGVGKHYTLEGLQNYAARALREIRGSVRDDPRYCNGFVGSTLDQAMEVWLFRDGSVLSHRFLDDEWAVEWGDRRAHHRVSVCIPMP